MKLRIKLFLLALSAFAALGCDEIAAQNGSGSANRANVIDSIDVSTTGDRIAFSMRGHFLAGSHSQFFIDADADPGTGYSNGAISGADYLIEDTALYRYPVKAHGWKWMKLDGAASVEKSDAKIVATVARNLLELGSSIRYGGRVATPDWKKKVVHDGMVSYQLSANGATGRYEVVKQAMTWLEARRYAREHNAHLVQIDSAEENRQVLELVRQAIQPDEYGRSVAADGGGAAYVWTGGNDRDDEGDWRWDYDGSAFWHGRSSRNGGHSVNGRYSNWGSSAGKQWEPDNHAGNQDALALALTEWPQNGGTLGQAGQWNDLNESDRLYLVLEYDQPAAENAAYSEIDYVESDEDFKNPERGLYTNHYLPSHDFRHGRATPGRLGYIIHGPYSTFVEKLVLLDFRNGPISSEYLDMVRQELKLVRDAGLKVIIRVTYNEDRHGTDAPLNIVLQHIRQLKPVFEDNRDVIMAVQAGFIGAWGEWHTSSNGLHADPEAKDAIKNALMANIPREIKIMFRNPPELMRWYPEPLDESEAHSGSDWSRAGFHDDCFNWNETDMGTFDRNPERRAAQFRYLEQATRYLPVVGELCTADVSTHHTTTSCDAAIDMASKFHYSLLGNQIRWNGSEQYNLLPFEVYEQQGCWGELKKRFGYRFVLRHAKIPQTAWTGTAFDMTVKLVNRGFAPMVNARPVYIVLEQQAGNAKHLIKVASDPRKWFPDEPVELRIHDVLPATLPAGRYNVSLWLPDKSDTLREDPRYAVRMANDRVWMSESGYNRLGEIEVIANPR